MKQASTQRKDDPELLLYYPGDLASEGAFLTDNKYRARDDDRNNGVLEAESAQRLQCSSLFQITSDPAEGGVLPLVLRIDHVESSLIQTAFHRLFGIDDERGVIVFEMSAFQDSPRDAVNIEMIEDKNAVGLEAVVDIRKRAHGIAPTGDAAEIADHIVVGFGKLGLLDVIYVNVQRVVLSCDFCE